MAVVAPWLASLYNLDYMTEAETLFNNVFKRWISQVSFILSFRRATCEGMQGARKAIEAEMLALLMG